MMSCTEKVSIEPEFSDKTDWVPLLAIEHNNYRRVELNLGELPRLEVERNLSRILVQFRTVGEAEFKNFDTLDLEFRRFLMPIYLSEPVLQENFEYECRLVVEYRNGVEQVSNTVRFVTPVVKGQILDSIAIPPQTFGCFGCSPEGFGFTETWLFVLKHTDELIRIHLNTLESTQLLSGFRPFDPRISGSYLGMAVYGDTAIFAENTRSEPDKMTVVRLNLQTLQVDKSLRVPFPKAGPFVYGRIVHYDGSDIYVLWNLEGEQQIEKIDVATGQVVESYPAFEELVGFFDELIFDGTDFWISINREFDNRIARFDPNGAIVSPVHRNPVFRSFDLAWDGDSFWVFDDEIDSIVKLKLEGL